MGRSRHILSLAVWVAAGLVLVRRFSSGELWVGPTAGRGEALRARVGCQAIIQRPVGGPPVKRKLAPAYRKHVAEGADRLPGPYRHLFLNKTIEATLEAATHEGGRGGLRDRYRDEIIEHLAEMRALREKGTPMEATVFWDYENMWLKESYDVDPYVTMDRALRWVAGIIDAPVTSVEAVEFTRNARTSQQTYLSGKRNWLHTLRAMGGVVHRAWPKMTDAADVVILERMRAFLDKAEGGGPQRIICLLSGDKGFNPMLQAAQSEGSTVIVLTGREEAHYFPGGRNFSVPIVIPSWVWVRKHVQNRFLDMFRPPEEWTPEQGPSKWTDGTVELRVQPEEEQDMRRLHGFIPKRLYLPAPAKFEGQWARVGLRLNDTLTAALQSALERTGTMGTRTGRLRPEAHAAVQKDLEDLSASSEEGHTAAVFWNFENMRLHNTGPTQMEMAGRIVRWFQGFLGMPVQRVEVSRYVEPWERLGASPHDWLFSMQKLGMVIHRVWPPRAEMTNLVLTRSVGALAKVAAATGDDAGSAGTEGGMRQPRLVCVFSEDLYFDDHMRAAQRAGVSAMWFGPEERAVYYPANSDETVRLNVLEWKTIMDELPIATVNPFLPGAWTPDAPPPRYQKTPIPVDVRWGKPEELELDTSPVRIPQELLESKVGIGF